MAVLRSVVVLLLFQLAGEVLHATLRLSLPGPVLGMVLLAAWLVFRNRRQKGIDPALIGTADGLLSVLGLLFVPAGVGVVANLSLLRSEWLPITVSLVVSTLLTLVVTASVMHALLARADRRPA